MAHLRERARKTGTFLLFVDDDGEETSIGPANRETRRLGQTWVLRYNRNKQLAKIGMLEQFPASCLWSLRDLSVAHLQDAANRGLRTAQPQFQGRASKMESHWRNLLAGLGDVNLDDITDTTLRAYIARRQQTVGPVPINRDLFGVLRPALRLARETESSGYRGDPFRSLRKLDERRGRREPIALTADECQRFVAVCRGISRPLGAFVELLLLTASRRGQTGALDGGFLRYPAHKRGIARAFRVEGRLAAVLKEPRAFSREAWARACVAFGVDLHPHDLRHTALTLEGNRPDATLLSLQKLGGWTSPAMAAVYLHADRGAIEPVRMTGVHRRGKT